MKKPCNECAIALIAALITGCAVMGVVGNGWLAIAAGLGVWFIGLEKRLRGEQE